MAFPREFIRVRTRTHYIINALGKYKECMVVYDQYKSLDLLTASKQV